MNNKTVKKINIRMILVIAFILVYVLFNYCNIRAEYLYNLELGTQYVDKFMQSMQYKTVIFGINFVLLFLFFYVVTIFVKKGLKKFFIEEKVEMPKLPSKSLALVISAILSIIVVPELSSKIILSMNAASFAMNDPIFNMDIGYYIFNQPSIEMMLKYIIFIGVVSLIYIAIYFIVTLNVYLNGVDRESLKKNTVVKLLVVILFMIVICISGLVYVKSTDVLFTSFLSLNNGIELTGAGAVDIIFKVWGYRILSVIILLSVILILVNIKKGDKKKAFKSVLIVPAYLVFLFVLMVGYQFIFVNRNQLETEYDNIKNNIESTQNAYNIKLEENELNYSGTVNYEEVQSNQEILNNISVIDKNVTLTTLNEYQSKQGYYVFNNTKLLEYNNELVYVTPREILNSNVISNKTYEYTHGFGTIITSATKLDKESGIKYLQSDLENGASKEFVKISEPRIYFGLENNNVVVTNSGDKKEFDYLVSTTEIATNTYEGKAGLNLGFFDRLILAVKEGNLGILVGSGVSEDSKILLNRNILDRVKTILPELIYDENPYMVISDEGRLVWVVDGYTVSDKYPYSNSTNITVEGGRKTINYIRNSVKVLVDAYDGTVSYYITDRNDPIIMAYRNIYPSIFMDLDVKIPDDINKHITYPEFLYNVQLEMLNVYHNIQPEVLYRNDDVWEVATYQFTATTNKVTRMKPNYTMVSVESGDGVDASDGVSAGERECRLGLVIPYTLEGKQNLNAYLVGYYDEANNQNVLVLNKFVSANGVLGPEQLERQINEDTEISKEIQKISLAGSKILKNLYIVPIENTILYVEPIYQILVNESPVPVLKRVIVSSGNKLAIGNTLDEALENLLSQYAVNIEVENSDDIEAVIESLIKANKNLKSSSESSNWTLMGQDIEKLQELIDKLEILKAQEKDDPTGDGLFNTNVM